MTQGFLQSCALCEWRELLDGTSLAQRSHMREFKVMPLEDFSFLDQEEFRSKYANGDRMRFYVEGLSCGKCVRSIENLAVTLPGVRQIRVDLATNMAHAEVDPERLAYSELATQISLLGFNPIPLAPESSAEKLIQSEDRRELIRLGVAGACAGNIMTFSFANYLGAAGEFATAFAWMSFALYLPVVFYVAIPFYRGAFNSLRQKRVSIDLPMAVASLSGFIFSVVELLRGKEDIYFDSLSGFLFLILLSRWTQRRLQRRFLRPQELMENLRLQRVRRVTPTGWEWTAVENLVPGQRILLSSPETLPAEAELVTSTAHFSLAWLSGESRPKTFLSGAVVPAGARLLSGDVQLIARKPLNDTAFGQILRQIQDYSLANNRAVNLADRWAQTLLTIVFLVAIAFLAAYWSVSPEEAVRRSLALIILACPCAMAFGTPLALAASLRKAHKAGLIVRSADVFEKCNTVETVFFDKTGTLTESDLELSARPAIVPFVYQKVILALENESLHPIAFAFRRAFGGDQQLPPVDGLREVPGVGVSGFVYGKHYELRKNVKPGQKAGCSLFEDHAPIMDFEFDVKLKPRCREVLDALREGRRRLVMLSGDSREVSQAVGQQLGFKPEDILSDCSPADKAKMLADTPRAMMIGDGVNDALAMTRADVGVAVSGGMETALKSAGVYLADPGLDGVLNLFRISREGFALVRRNLAISIVYNSAGGLLALLGFINPYVAALLMPASSGFILLSTWLKGRDS